MLGKLLSNRNWYQISDDPRSYESNFCNCVWKPEKILDFIRVWTRDLGIPVRPSNRISYEATDAGGWSFVGSNEIVITNEWMMKWYMKYIIYWTADVKSQPERNSCNCVWKPEKSRTSTGFEPLITARFIAYLISHPQFNIWCISYVISSEIDMPAYWVVVQAFEKSTSTS